MQEVCVQNQNLPALSFNYETPVLDVSNYINSFSQSNRSESKTDTLEAIPSQDEADVQLIVQIKGSVSKVLLQKSPDPSVSKENASSSDEINQKAPFASTPQLLFGQQLKESGSHIPDGTFPSSISNTVQKPKPPPANSRPERPSDQVCADKCHEPQKTDSSNSRDRKQIICDSSLWEFIVPDSDEEVEHLWNMNTPEMEGSDDSSASSVDQDPQPLESDRLHEEIMIKTYYTGSFDAFSDDLGDRFEEYINSPEIEILASTLVKFGSKELHLCLEQNSELIWRIKWENVNNLLLSSNTRFCGIVEMVEKRLHCHTLLCQPNPGVLLCYISKCICLTKKNILDLSLSVDLYFAVRHLGIIYGSMHKIGANDLQTSSKTFSTSSYLVVGSDCIALHDSKGGLSVKISYQDIHSCGVFSSENQFAIGLCMWEECKIYTYYLFKSLHVCAVDLVSAIHKRLLF